MAESWQVNVIEGTPTLVLVTVFFKRGGFVAMTVVPAVDTTLSLVRTMGETIMMTSCC